MTDADKALVVALAALAVACIATIGQLLGEIRRARQEVGAERRQVVDDQRERKRTEQLIDELQQQSQRMQADNDDAGVAKALDAIERQQQDNASGRMRAIERALRAARADEARELRRRLYDEWAVTHDDVAAEIMSGVQPLPDEWVQQKLAEWGLDTKTNPTRTSRFRFWM